MLKTLELQRETLFFSDVQVRGYYSAYTARWFKELGVELRTEAGDEEILRSYPADYVSFSYYMSTAASAHPENYDRVSGNLLIKGVKNLYLETSEWGWQIDAKELRIALNQLYDR